LKTPSLRFRLLLLSSASIAVALLVAGFAIALLFASHIERSQRAQLEHQLLRLAALVEPGPAMPELRQAMPDPRYESPAGGLYWQVTDPDTHATSRSRSLWDTVLPYPVAALVDRTPIAAKLTDPAGLPLVALVQRLSFERDGGIGDRILDLVVAETTSGVDAANTAFRSDLVRALAVLALVLISAGWLQVMLGLAPLAVIKRGIAAIRSGHSHHLEGAFPKEVMPLVSEVNELLDLQERSIAFARERAADLAHGLKTSLTLLNGHAYSLRQQGSDGPAAAIETLVDDMTATIDHQLRLSRLRHRSRSDRQSTILAPIVDKVVAALRLTAAGQEIRWKIAVPPDSQVGLDAMDLTELLGVLVENATKWAKTTVSLTTEAQADRLLLCVEDDGPGLDEAQMQLLGQRGQRFDNAQPGYGLGLAIAREIVLLNGAELQFARSGLGGLSVSVLLPPAAGNRALPR
jgi:signal transduction histidine kinase